MTSRNEHSAPRHHPSPPSYGGSSSDSRPRFQSVNWGPSPPRSPSREAHRRQPSQSSERSVSRSRSHSRSHPHRRREPSPTPSDDPLKPWFKKKTLWSTVATIATVAALVPAAVSAKASHDAADASKASARASTRSAQAVERSTHAVVNTTIAQGHMDGRGRYTGPREHVGQVGAELLGYDAERGRGRERRHPRGGGSRRIEYGSHRGRRH